MRRFDAIRILSQKKFSIWLKNVLRGKCIDCPWQYYCWASENYDKKCEEVLEQWLNEELGEGETIC